MFVYEKKLQYPVRIKNTNPKLASIIISRTAARMASSARPSGICPSAIPCRLTSSAAC